ncbi:MAG TPA: hypothetical protein VF086_07110 [Propionibacteriaceae bacterium]
MSNTQVLRTSRADYVKAAIWWRVNHQPGQDTASAGIAFFQSSLFERLHQFLALVDPLPLPD